MPFRPIIREIQILYYKWARKDLRLQPLHPDLPVVVMRLNDLMSERPRPALKNRCASGIGLCNRDAACADYSCEGHPWQRLHTRDGGHQVVNEFSVRLEHLKQLPLRDRALIGAVGAAVVVLIASIMQALGLPVTLLF